jgi:metacaspase-1
MRNYSCSTPNSALQLYQYLLMSIALLVGINYTGSAYELSGCDNDLTNWSTYLSNRCKYITTLWDAQATKINIQRALWALVRDSYMCDPKEIWFVYSGHGAQVRDRNGDEIDGLDEAIVTFELETILDDELNLIFSHLNGKPKTYLIYDCCHSGTIVDKLRNPNLTLISGCRDNETSGDTPDGGVLSKCLLAELRANSDVVYCAKKLSHITKDAYGQEVTVTQFRSVD